ncbi:MAG: leucine-rich repeat protein [Clostridia bacterium]|nr:leucine-rich repeat protein [Clostridia bacterium]
MKKITPIIISVAIMLCVAFCFAGCGSLKSGGDNSDSDKYELKLEKNIASAGTISGEGKYKYNEDLYIVAEAKSGYYFLGWYRDDDLLSTSAKYNCKMWDKDVTLEARFTAAPKGYNGNGSSGSNSITNQKYSVNILSATPNYGNIQIDNGGYITEYTSKKATGNSVKALALTKSEKRFLGWFDEAGNQITANAIFEFAMPCFDYTLLAKWECNCEYDTYESNTYICSVCGGKAIYGKTDENGFVTGSIDDQGETILAYVGRKEIITIPSKYTAIGKSVFNDNKTITKVIIPESVTYISDYAFQGCDNLTICCQVSDKPEGWSSNWNSSNCPVVWSYIEEIEFVADGIRYRSTGGHSVTVVGPEGSIYDVETITIPNTVSYQDIEYLVVSIENEAFKDCNNLTSVTIGNNITSIGEKAFWGCYVESIVLPDSVIEIGTAAFAQCYYLNELTIGNGVTIIPEEAFRGANIERLTIPDSVIEVGERAFASCSNLKVVTVGKGVQKFGFYAFEGDNVKEVHISDIANWCGITFEKQNSNPLCTSSLNAEPCDLYLNDELVIDLVIPDTVRTIGDYAFYECGSIESVTIPYGVWKIGGYAFVESNLSSATFKNTNGWEASSKIVSSSDLSNEWKAARLLKDTFYSSSGWER